MKNEPLIASYGPPDNPWWITFQLKNATYEYHASHPDTIKAIQGVYRKSKWRALNLAKKQCRLERIDRSTKPVKWNPRTLTYRIKEQLPVPENTTPMQFALGLYKAGKRFGYHWGRFYVFETEAAQGINHAF